MIKIRRLAISSIVLTLLMLLVAPLNCFAATINNDCFWKDTQGNNIYSQGGGIFNFGGTYYWYGVEYNGAITYAACIYSGSSDICFFES